jgi:hypothetical protein
VSIIPEVGRKVLKYFRLIIKKKGITPTDRKISSENNLNGKEWAMRKSKGLYWGLKRAGFWLERVKRNNLN